MTDSHLKKEMTQKPSKNPWQITQRPMESLKKTFWKLCLKAGTLSKIPTASTKIQIHPPSEKKNASKNPIKGSWRRAKWINWSEAKWFSIRRTISQINGWTVARTSLTHRSKNHHQREKGPKMTLECGATPHVEELQIGRRHDGRQWLYERWGGELYMIWFAGLIWGMHEEWTTK